MLSSFVESNLVENFSFASNPKAIIRAEVEIFVHHSF